MGVFMVVEGGMAQVLELCDLMMGKLRVRLVANDRTRTKTKGPCAGKLGGLSQFQAETLAAAALRSAAAAARSAAAGSALSSKRSIARTGTRILPPTLTNGMTPSSAA